MSGTAFSWVSGVVTVAVPRPISLASRSGLRPFFEDPNNPEWGELLPRWLYHECLHFWQLTSSRYLQRLVAEEWQRLLKFEREGRVEPVRETRASYGHVLPGEPFSVRDLVECHARYWDVHTRGPKRILEEEGDDLDELLPAFDRHRAINGNRGYSDREFHAVMAGGRDREIYAAPYRWMHERAITILSDGAHAASLNETVWAINLAFPVAAFLALNTLSPVRAFIAAFDHVLSSEVVRSPADWRGPWNSINLDWLDSWHRLKAGLSMVLEAIDLTPLLDLKIIKSPLLSEHPVYRHLSARFDSMIDDIGEVYKNTEWWMASSPIGRQFDIDFFNRQLEVAVQDPWAVFALPGQPEYRFSLAAAFSPPLVRFMDADTPATTSANPRHPWPVDAPSLVSSVEGTEMRWNVFRINEKAAHYSSI